MSLFRPLMLVLPVLLCLVAGCSPLRALDGGDAAKVTRDIAFGPLNTQKLDIYVPRGGQGRMPVVVFFHGGRWQSGDKDDYAFAAQAFASHGFVVVLPRTRLYPDVRFPEFLRDGARAVSWTHANVARYNGDARNIFVAGHSSGAYTAAMLAMDPQWLRDRKIVRGLVGLAGPYDFLPFTDGDVKDIFSTAPDKTLTQPIHFVSKNSPPAFLATGDADDSVKPKNTVNLARALRDHGVAVTEKHYAGVGHVGLLLSLSTAFRGRTSALDDAAGFIRAQSR